MPRIGEVEGSEVFFATGWNFPNFAPSPGEPQFLLCTNVSLVLKCTNMRLCSKWKAGRLGWAVLKAGGVSCATRLRAELVLCRKVFLNMSNWRKEEIISDHFLSTTWAWQRCMYRRSYIKLVHFVSASLIRVAGKTSIVFHLLQSPVGQSWHVGQSQWQERLGICFDLREHTAGRLTVAS